MASRFRQFGLVLLTTVSLAAGVRAQSPRVTLTLRGVTAEEAVAKLANAANIPVSVYTQGAPQGSLTGRADFDWQNLTLAQAMRQICARFDLRPGRAASGYVLHPNLGGAAEQPVKRACLVEKNGVRLFLKGVSLYENRRLNLLNGKPVLSGSTSLQLQIGAELGDLDIDTLAGIQNVTARDDQGNHLAMEAANYHAGSADGFPDQWTTSVALPAPPPQARKLAWMEGDVMVFRHVKSIHVEIPLPLAERVARREEGALAFSVSEYHLRPQDPEDDPEPLLRRNNPNPGNVLTLRTRVYMPAMGALQSRSGWGILPYVVGQSGRIYAASQASSPRSGSDGKRMVVENTLSFPGLSEPPARLVWDLLERGDPEKLFSFRMMDIPLPGPLVRPPAGEQDPPINPFYQKGGGTLILPVKLPENGVRSGRLDVGLAPRQGAGWGATRWVELKVTDGEAKLSDIRPGVYKVVRRFLPRDGELPSNVRWINGEVPGTIAAGKELRLPPLEWEAAGAAARPAGQRGKD